MYLAQRLEAIHKNQDFIFSGTLLHFDFLFLLFVCVIVAIHTKLSSLNHREASFFHITLNKTPKTHIPSQTRIVLNVIQQFE